ncbi:pyridoxal phosphate-dependent aminotransferase [Desulfitibacter alkalitolerans]|uniref:pyridoxal phosphate-dependent aminotransferase n=1 Tax=Desulfitibacter alkalitolerans TaxID=264641 RepID=UPI0004806F52|nr:pyridoxal phosphate-dependent aminotransferase [Desulfitibacter alkalitolerans]
MNNVFSPGKRFLAKRLEESATDERRKMIALSNEVKDVINLGRGDPDLKTPSHIIAAAKEALDAGHTGYTPWAGLLELRQAVAEKLKNDNNIIVDPDKEVIITVGAQEAILLAILSVINPGEEIIVPEPRYTPYDSAIKLAGGVMVPVQTKQENNFEVKAEDIAKVVTEKTKAILLISPNNPTGSVISKENLEEIAELAEREDLIVISDELYEKLIFDNTPLYSIASLPRMFERTLTVNGFSKSYSMTGWRVGYIAGPRDLISAMLNLKYTMTICTPAVSQMAALAALKGPQECIKEIQEVYDERRAVTMRRLDKLGIKYVVPKGTFYIFPDIRKFGMTSYEFASCILKNTGVFTFPGTVFGPSGEGFIRISILVPVEKIEEAFDRMEDFLTEQNLLNIS